MQVHFESIWWHLSQVSPARLRANLTEFLRSALYQCGLMDQVLKCPEYANDFKRRRSPVCLQRVPQCLALCVALSLLVVASQPCQAQLYVGAPNSDIQLETLNEFVLFDPVSKSQVLALEFSFSSDVMPVGLILPVSPDSKLLLGKRELFDALTKITQPKLLKQRQLKLSFSSYLWRLIAIETPPPLANKKRHRSAKVSKPVQDLTRQQAIDWAIEHGLYLSVRTATSLLKLESLGHRFKVLLMEPSAPNKNGADRYQNRFNTQTIFIRSRTERPQTLTNEFAGDRNFVHRIGLLSDQPYGLHLSGESHVRTAYRDYLDKRHIKKVISTIPKVMHTYQRAAYFQSFELPQERSDRIQARAQRTPAMVKPKEVASYDPLLITIPFEVLILLAGVGLWAWNREKSPLRTARSKRIKLR